MSSYTFYSDTVNIICPKQVILFLLRLSAGFKPEEENDVDAADKSVLHHPEAPKEKSKKMNPKPKAGQTWWLLGRRHADKELKFFTQLRDVCVMDCFIDCIVQAF